MAKNIKEVFNEYCDGLKINSKLIKEIHRLQIGFVNRNDNHVDFFGSHLLGVYEVHYRTSDRHIWMNDILEVEENDIYDAVMALGTVDKSWTRASDPVNLSCIWLMHQIHNAPNLTARERETGLIDVALILQYKFITSIMSHYFPYPTDASIAEETYRTLSRKFDLKEHGSWGALLYARAKAIVASNSIHYSTITRMNDDDGVVYMVSDIQQRLREIVKKITAVFYQVRDNQSRIVSTSSVIEIDGGLEVKDKTRDYTAYARYMHDIITDKPTFIRTEVVRVVCDAMSKLPEKNLLESLDYCSRNYGKHGDKNIALLIDETLLHAFEYITSQKGLMASPSDLGRLIANLRSLYMASRMSDPGLLKMRELANKIVAKSITSRNSAVQASTRTGLQLFLVLRAFTRGYYS